MSRRAAWIVAFLGTTAAVIGALVVWLPAHFWIRYHRKSRRSSS